MHFFKWKKNDILLMNKFGIPEPISSIKVIPKIILVPLLAFDKNKYRLGYGSGFYDRTIAHLEKKKKITTIGIGFYDQRIEELPRMKFDKRLDLIITENGVQI